MRLSPTTMLGRRTCAGRPGARAHQALGLELGALVGVAEALPHVEALLAEGAAVGARHVGGRHVREAIEPLAARRAALGQVDHPAGPVDVHAPRVVEAQRERHRRRAVHDRRDAFGQLVGPARVQAEPRPLDVPGPGAEPLVPGQPRGGLAVVAGTHQRMHVAIVAVQEAGEQLPSNEAGRPGQEHFSHPFGSQERAPAKRGARPRPPCRPGPHRAPRAGSPRPARRPGRRWRRRAASRSGSRVVSR